MTPAERRPSPILMQSLEDSIPADGDSAAQKGNSEPRNLRRADVWRKPCYRLSNSNDRTNNSLDHHQDGDKFWQSGAEAFGCGTLLEECPAIFQALSKMIMDSRAGLVPSSKVTISDSYRRLPILLPLLQRATGR